MSTINDDMVKRFQLRSYDILQEPLKHLLPIHISDDKSIISLEKAIEPLISLLPDLQKFVCIAKEKCENPNDGLTTDESVCIMLYTMDWEPIEECLCYVLNSTLRSEDRQKLKPWFLYLQLFLKALSHFSSVSQTVYYQIEYDLIEKYPLGKTFIWWSFSLCSLSLNNYQPHQNFNELNSRTIFIIECSSGKDIRKHSYYSNDDQVLLMSASEFKVISSLKNTNGQHIIHLKEIQSNHFFNKQEILSANLLLNISNRNIQSRSRVETIEKYIDRILKLQNKIEKYSLYSSIDLTRENLDDQDISLIIQHAIIKKQCSILRLDQNFFTSDGITILTNSLYNNKTLIGLNLYSNRLFDKGIYPLGKLLSNNYSIIQKLHLGSNRISNHGVLLLAEMLKTNTMLTVLWLDSNRITDEGVHYLTNALIHHNKTLKELSLKKNRFITSLSIPYFNDIFQNNQSLIEIDLTDCGLTKQDNQHLRHLSNDKKYFKVSIDTQKNDCIIS